MTQKLRPFRVLFALLALQPLVAQSAVRLDHGMGLDILVCDPIAVKDLSDPSGTEFYRVRVTLEDLDDPRTTVPAVAILQPMSVEPGDINSIFVLTGRLTEKKDWAIFESNAKRISLKIKIHGQGVHINLLGQGLTAKGEWDVMYKYDGEAKCKFPEYSSVGGHNTR